MTVKLEVSTRDGSTAALRAQGKVPAVVYGPKQEPVSLAVDKQEFTKVLESAGESTIISLAGLDQEIEVLIHDVAFDPARGGVEHVDFYAIERGKELTTHVALDFVGEAPVTKTGAMVNKPLHEIEVTCRPSNLPSEITVDLSALKAVSDVIMVKDLAIPADVKVETDPELVVAAVSAARKAESESDESADELTPADVLAEKPADTDAA